jgi:hypothetical protein
MWYHREGKFESKGRNVLAYQEDIHLAEVELIVEG